MAVIHVDEQLASRRIRLVGISKELEPKIDTHHVRPAGIGIDGGTGERPAPARWNSSAFERFPVDKNVRPEAFVIQLLIGHSFPLTVAPAAHSEFGGVEMHRYERDWNSGMRASAGRRLNSFARSPARTTVTSPGAA